MSEFEAQEVPTYKPKLDEKLERKLVPSDYIAAEVFKVWPRMADLVARPDFTLECHHGQSPAERVLEAFEKGEGIFDPGLDQNWDQYKYFGSPRASVIAKTNVALNKALGELPPAATSAIRLLAGIKPWQTLPLEKLPQVLGTLNRNLR